LYSAFEKLPENKRELILKVCIEEFAKTGYEKTSTDTITSRAGISKGILFHYFKSKKNLYFYIIQYITKLLGDKVMEETNKVTTDDFFDRIKEVVLIKLKVQHQYLTETQLATAAILHPPIELKEEIGQLYQEYVEIYKESYLAKLLDGSLLQGDASPEKVMNLTMLALENVSKKYTELFESKQLDYLDILEQMMPEIDEYIDIIKYGVYRYSHRKTES
jgi:AcrR family transcriptional regulator